MDEGVDPTHMCQNLVQKVAQSKQLQAIADPDLLILFEDWLDELEDEVINKFKEGGKVSLASLVHDLGLSENGAAFMIAKLRREDKI